MQLCWAHLKRNILGIADYARSPSARQFCRDTLAIVARLFRLWYRFRGELRDRRGNPQPIDRRQLLIKSIPLQRKCSLWRRRTCRHRENDERNRRVRETLHRRCYEKEQE